MTGKTQLFSKCSYIIKWRIEKISSCIRNHRLLSLMGFLILWFSFNCQDHRGIGDGDLLSKELICVVWLLRVNGGWLRNTNVDGGKIKLWIQGLCLMEGIVKIVVVWTPSSVIRASKSQYSSTATSLAWQTSFSLSSKVFFNSSINF